MVKDGTYTIGGYKISVKTRDDNYVLTSVDDRLPGFNAKIPRTATDKEFWVIAKLKLEQHYGVKIARTFGDRRVVSLKDFKERKKRKIATGSRP